MKKECSQIHIHVNTDSPYRSINIISTRVYYPLSYPVAKYNVDNNSIELGYNNMEGEFKCLQQYFLETLHDFTNIIINNRLYSYKEAIWWFAKNLI